MMKIPIQTLLMAVESDKHLTTTSSPRIEININIIIRPTQKTTFKNWLVVEPTHLKNMLVKMGSSSPIFGVKIKNIWVATTQKIKLFLLWHPSPDKSPSVKQIHESLPISQKRSAHKMGKRKKAASRKLLRRPHRSAKPGCNSLAFAKKYSTSYLPTWSFTARPWKVPETLRPLKFVTESQKERIIFQPSFFRGELLNFGGVRVPSLVQTWHPPLSDGDQILRWKNLRPVFINPDFMGFHLRKKQKGFSIHPV